MCSLGQEQSLKVCTHSTWLPAKKKNPKNLLSAPVEKPSALTHPCYLTRGCLLQCLTLGHVGRVPAELQGEKLMPQSPCCVLLAPSAAQAGVRQRFCLQILETDTSFSYLLVIYLILFPLRNNRVRKTGKRVSFSVGRGDKKPLSGICVKSYLL